MGARSSGLNCAAVGGSGVGHSLCDPVIKSVCQPSGDIMSPDVIRAAGRLPQGHRGRARPARGAGLSIHHGAPGHAQAWLSISFQFPSILSTIFSRLHSIYPGKHEASKTISVQHSSEKGYLLKQGQWFLTVVQGPFKNKFASVTLDVLFCFFLGLVTAACVSSEKTFTM